MVATLERGAVLRTQLQFVDGGELAGLVMDWLVERYDHLQPHCMPGPGLNVLLTVPAEHHDSCGGWHARFLEATGPLDLALEVLAECFEDLGLPEMRVLSMHLTDELTPT